MEFLFLNKTLMKFYQRKILSNGLVIIHCLYKIQSYYILKLQGNHKSKHLLMLFTSRTLYKKLSERRKESFIFSMILAVKKGLEVLIKE